MADDNILNTPLLWVNKYLEKKITELGDFERVPFFPSTPTTLDDLTEMFVQSPDGIMCVYDRLSRMNKNKFPHIKTEQILYYFYATAENTSVNMIKIQERVLRLLDRGDESAEEVNNWCSNRKVRLDDGSTINNVFYFHTFKVYQLEEARDIIDFGTARTYGGNKFIIEFEYHSSPALTGHNWTPEFLAQGVNKIII
jgi:hypothetical protein